MATTLPSLPTQLLSTSYLLRRGFPCLPTCQHLHPFTVIPSYARKETICASIQSQFPHLGASLSSGISAVIPASCTQSTSLICTEPFLSAQASAVFQPFPMLASLYFFTLWSKILKEVGVNQSPILFPSFLNSPPGLHPYYSTKLLVGVTNGLMLLNPMAILSSFLVHVYLAKFSRSSGENMTNYITRQHKITFQHTLSTIDKSSRITDTIWLFLLITIFGTEYDTHTKI